ncbi:hypothetical protein ASPCAL01972 [Aspergillus calidoustus]|uniref:Uncharacterized protein n=1 Tax=Aspergillus calidoustus TaxID=454130 RepID=A0A0U5CM00_ASPCI|nr:hypothetical protein ASPCAL01972 [Aspergillus calidoustus]
MHPVSTMGTRSTKRYSHQALVTRSVGFNPEPRMRNTNTTSRSMLIPSAEEYLAYRLGKAADVYGPQSTYAHPD